MMGHMREPQPAPRRGRIILLSGASSSGKSTLARELQELVEECLHAWRRRGSLCALQLNADATP
jgi:adenylylsulfate kinase-like enzyme